MSPTNASLSRALLRPAVLWPALLLCTALLYLFGLNGPFAPTNGDEMVYIHIARMTAESGHWLPLQSELVGTRNTKPPLLIWQAIAASGWGQHWSLLALRLPSIAYTFASTALLAFFAWRISGKRRTACLAAVLYLLYFSTFRYGRVYLTSAPETFWLALPMWWLLWLSLRKTVPTQSAHPAWGNPAPGTAALAAPARLGWLAYTLFGLAMGLGAAYKSFALVAPASAAIWCAALWSAPQPNWKSLARCTAGVTWSAFLGLGFFALWFVLDPDPAAVWQEFVLAENAGKMSNTMGYWQAAFNGPYPMWTQLLAYPANAGLLALTGLGLCWRVLQRGLRRSSYGQLQPAQRVLLAWLLVWLIVFTIPSQRSERYVIPAMPALAIAMALLWQHIGRIWSVATLLLLAPALVLLARIAWVIGTLEVGSVWQGGLAVLVAALGLLAVALGLFNARWTRNASLLACASVYACFGLMVAPLSNPQTDYTEAIHVHLRGKKVAVPNGFTGQYENYHFVLPGSRIFPFDAEGRNTGERYPEMPAPERLQRLLSEFDAVVWLQDSDAQEQPSCLPHCQLLAQRWHVKSRHKAGAITLDNIWEPQDWLFSREWLLVKTPA
jgi:4-amino-4-deoxy-L-arabinose transferase-like glycosyltransferase